MAMELTKEEQDIIKIRTYMITLFTLGEDIPKKYEEILSPIKNKELIGNIRLADITSFFNNLELYLEDREKAFEKDRYSMAGFEGIYSEGERKEIIEIIKHYRTPFDKIYVGEKLNELECSLLKEAGTFFGDICKVAKNKLPVVKIKKDNKIPIVTK